MQWWQWLVGILLFIISLSVLVGIHELGHLSAAKLFHVYCFNYSIGFGPTLISSKRSKKHETIWTLRAIPLGGFVSMYGEGVEVEEGLYIPPSRSLEGVARYKRAIIISAGVILNFVLGYVLIFVHNVAFPHIYFDSSYKYGHQSTIVCSVRDNPNFPGVNDGDALVMSLDPIKGVFILQSEPITLQNVNYMFCMNNSVSTTKTDPNLLDSLCLYECKDIQVVIKENFDASKDKDYATKLSYRIAYDKSKEEAEAWFKSVGDKEEAYKLNMSEYYKSLKVPYSVDLTKKYTVAEVTPNEVDATLTFIDVKSKTSELKVKPFKLKKNTSNNNWQDFGVTIKRFSEWYGFNKSLRVSGQEWCSANSTIFTALGRLFTGDVSTLGGPVAIASQSSKILSNFGFERYLYMWGMISCNLAIINLLPFPGLDGWSLLVIGYEALTKKQIKTKVKNIVSLIGLILLFGLMILVFVMDIVRLVL